MSKADTRRVLTRFCGHIWEKGKDSVSLSHQKALVGEGGEHEHVLDEVFGI